MEMLNPNSQSNSFIHAWYVLLWCDTALTWEATLERDLTFSRSLVPEERSRTASLSPTTAIEAAAPAEEEVGTAIGGFEVATALGES